MSSWRAFEASCTTIRRLDRREATRGDGIPFRLDLPGRSAPRPQVVICLDVSESMWYTKGKIWAARVAAQAIALAVRDAGGDVVGVLFDDTWLAGAGRGDALLFAPAAWPTPPLRAAPTSPSCPTSGGATRTTGWCW